MIFILVTLFIDILGLGIIIPVLPELIREFTGGVDSQGLSRSLLNFASDGLPVSAP